MHVSSQKEQPLVGAVLASESVFTTMELIKQLVFQEGECVANITGVDTLTVVDEALAPCPL